MTNNLLYLVMVIKVLCHNIASYVLTLYYGEDMKNSKKFTEIEKFAFLFSLSVVGMAAREAKPIGLGHHK